MPVSVPCSPVQPFRPVVLLFCGQLVGGQCTDTKAERPRVRDPPPRPFSLWSLGTWQAAAI